MQKNVTRKRKKIYNFGLLGDISKRKLVGTTGFNYTGRRKM